MMARVIKWTFTVVTLAVCFCGQNKGDIGDSRKNDSDTAKSASQAHGLGNLGTVDTNIVDSLPSPAQPESEIEQSTQAISGDTLVINRSKGMIISKKWAIRYLEYEKKLKLWYNPYIIDFNRKDTTKIKASWYDDDDQGSTLFCEASPNLKYVVLDYIDAGFVSFLRDDGKEETFLHQKYSCVIVDIEKAKMIHLMDSDCSGLWNDKNNWVVYDDDNIVFNSKEYEKD
jgi:hypothetical protein